MLLLSNIRERPPMYSPRHNLFNSTILKRTTWYMIGYNPTRLRKKKRGEKFATRFRSAGEINNRYRSSARDWGKSLTSLALRILLPALAAIGFDAPADRESSLLGGSFEIKFARKAKRRNLGEKIYRQLPRVLHAPLLTLSPLYLFFPLFFFLLLVWEIHFSV